jgi:endonuclease/exonuclease/phosphatase family metal-dependent hydrolase
VATPEILTGNFAPFGLVLWPPGSLRIVDWNIARGVQLSAVMDFLAGTNADIITLQEADLNARRSHRLNIAEEIAKKLQMNYVFGREFEELTQGSKASPAYHGQATLAKWPISNPRIIHFSQQSQFWRPRWYLPGIAFQERLGGRIALISDVSIARNKFVTYNLHLESRGNDELRLSQLQEVLADAAQQEPQYPLLIAGDFNMDVSRNRSAAALAKVGVNDAIAAPRTPTIPSRGLFEPGRQIDWAFIRGPVRAVSGRVHNTVTGSDHYPISFTLTAS